MDNNRTRKTQDGSPPCVVIFMITPICKTFEGMKFPSVKPDTETAVPVPYMGTSRSKQGFTFSTNMLGNLSAKKNKITCNTE